MENPPKEVKILLKPLLMMQYGYSTPNQKQMEAPFRGFLPL